MLVTLPLLVIHLMTCVSVFVAYRFRTGGEFSFFHHAIIPFVTGLLTLVPIWGSIYYNPDPPFSYAPWIALVWFLIGAGVYFYLNKNRPRRLAALESEIERTECAKIAEKM